MSEILDAYLANNPPVKPWNPETPAIELQPPPPPVSGEEQPFSEPPVNAHPALDIQPKSDVLDSYQKTYQPLAQAALKQRAKELYVAAGNGLFKPTDQQFHQLYQTVYGDTTPVSALKEAGKGAGDFASHAWDWIWHGDSATDTAKWVGHVIGTGARAVGTVMNPFATPTENAQTGADIISSVANVGKGLVDTGAKAGIGALNLADYLDAKNHSGTMTPEQAASNREERIKSDLLFRPYTYRAGQWIADKYTDATGIVPNPESDVGKTAGIAVALLPAGAAGEAESLIAPAVEKIVQTGGRGALGAVKVAKTAAPAVAAAATVHSMSLPSIVTAAAELAAGYGYGGEFLPKLARIRQAVVDNTFGKAEDFFRLFSESPEGVPAMQELRDGINGKIDINKNKIDFLRDETSNRFRVDQKAPDGTPLFDAKELNKDRNLLMRELQDGNDTLGRRSKMADSYINLNKTLVDGTKLGLGTAAYTAVGGAIMGGFGALGANTPDEIRPATEQGIKTGVQFTAPFAPLGAARGMESLRHAQASTELTKLGQLHSITPDHPDYEIAQRARAQADPAALAALDKEQGVIAHTGKKIIPFTPEDWATMGHTDAMPPEAGAAPNGFIHPETGDVYANVNAIKSGVLPHEVTHVFTPAATAMSTEIGKTIAEALRNPTPEGQAKIKNFMDTYGEAMRRTNPNFDSLPPEQQIAETIAELGRDIRHHMPAEEFYGGKSGLQLIKDGVMGIAAKLGLNKPLGDIASLPSKALGAIEVPGTREQLKSMLYQEGEKARAFKNGDLTEASVGAPDSGGGSGQPTPHQDAATGLPERATGVQTNIDDAISALQKMKTLSKAEIQSRIQAGLAEASKQGFTPTAGDLFKYAVSGKFSEAPEGLVKAHIDFHDGRQPFMPASDGEPGPNVDSEPWVHRYFELDKKDQAGTITPPEETEMDQLHQQAKKEYGSYDNFYKAHGGKQYNAGNLFDDAGGRIQGLPDNKPTTNYMPASPPESEEFKKWSGGAPVVLNSAPYSKRLDLGKGHKFKTGEPVVVGAYHGYEGDKFNEFDPKKLGSSTGAPSAKEGFFFAGKPETAEAYTGGRPDPNQLESTATHYLSMAEEAKQRGNSNSLFNWETPESNRDFVANAEANGQHFMKLAEEARKIDPKTDEIIKDPSARLYFGEEGNPEEGKPKGSFAMQRDRNLGYKPARESEEDDPKYNAMHEVYVKFQNPFVHDFGGEHYREQSYHNLLKEAKKNGHDGAIFMNTFDGADQADNIFVAFDNKNIKSTENKGTFDPSNPDIRFMPSTPEEYKPVADQFGLKYAGAMEHKDKSLHLFNDPKTGSTISVDSKASPKELQQKIEASRGKFGQPSFMPSDRPDAIKEAAIRYDDGKIYTGIVHQDALSKATDDGRDRHSFIGGFVDNAGKFYNRDEALAQAKKIKQITTEGYKKAADYYAAGEFKPDYNHGESLNFARAREFMPSRVEGEFGDAMRKATDEIIKDPSARLYFGEEGNPEEGKPKGSFAMQRDRNLGYKPARESEEDLETP